MKKNQRTIRNTPEMSIRLKTDAFKSASEHNEAFDDLIKSVEKLKLNRADLIEEILEDEKEKHGNNCANRSEGFPLTGYFVPGRDGAGVGQDSRILPAPSLTNIRRFYDR